MTRYVLGGVAGYLVFSVSAVLLFQVAGVDPHDALTTAFLTWSFPYGVVCAGVGGWLARRLGVSWHGPVIMAGLMFLSGAVSIMARPGAGLSQLATIFLFTPSALGGGRVAQGRTLPAT